MDENFTDLFESTARQAAQAVTEERRGYLASLVANGIDGERLSFVESKQILRLLSEINDVEVIWLRFFLHPNLNGDHVFREKHKAVIKPISAVLGSNQATLDKHSFQQNYLQHLVSLGLLAKQYQLDSKTGYPLFDKTTNNWKIRGHQLTPLADSFCARSDFQNRRRSRRSACEGSCLSDDESIKSKNSDGDQANSAVKAGLWEPLRVLRCY